MSLDQAIAELRRCAKQEFAIQEVSVADFAQMIKDYHRDPAGLAEQESELQERSRQWWVELQERSRQWWKSRTSEWERDSIATREEPAFYGELLFRTACKVGNEMERAGSYETLNARACRFRAATVGSQYFTSMCAIAAYLVCKTTHHAPGPDKPDLEMLDQLAPDSKVPNSLESYPKLKFSCPKIISQDLGEFPFPATTVPRPQAYLSAFVRKLKRISMWYGAPRLLQRVIFYFDDLLNRADQENLRGSYLIVACCEASKAEDSLHESSLWCNWLDDDFHDSATVMLAAAERAATDTPSIKEPAIAPISSLATVPPVAESPVSKCPSVNKAIGVSEVGRTGESSVLPSKAATITSVTESEEPESDTKYKWLGPDDELPEGFDKRALNGQFWEIAWALGEGKIFRGCLPKHLLGKLKKGDACSKKLGRYEFAVYLAIRYKDFIPSALESLRVIQERGPYHHEGDELRAEYKNHRKKPLKCASEEKLITVLCEFEILEQPTQSSLHGAIKNGGKFRGVFDRDRNFVLYVHNDFPPETVEAISKRLEELNQFP